MRSTLKVPGISPSPSCLGSSSGLVVNSLVLGSQLAGSLQTLLVGGPPPTPAAAASKRSLDVPMLPNFPCREGRLKLPRGQTALPAESALLVPHASGFSVSPRRWGPLLFLRVGPCRSLLLHCTQPVCSASLCQYLGATELFWEPPVAFAPGGPDYVLQVPQIPLLGTSGFLTDPPYAGPLTVLLASHRILVVDRHSPYFAQALTFLSSGCTDGEPQTWLLRRPCGASVYITPRLPPLCLVVEEKHLPFSKALLRLSDVRKFHLVDADASGSPFVAISVPAQWAVAAWQGLPLVPLQVEG